MTQSAVAYGQSLNGTEAVSSGLVTHRGLLDVTTIRVRGSTVGQPYVLPTQHAGAGQGVELLHFPNQYGVVQAYDRENAAWMDLYVQGKNITLVATGGKVSLPAGTAQSLLGYYWNGVTWSLPATSQWYETPVQASFTNALGGVWRIEFTAHILSSTANAGMYLGVGVDGSLTWGSLAVVNVPANQLQVVSSFIYHTGGPAGTHRVSVWMMSTSAGGGLNATGNSSIWVTEQRA